MNVKNEVSVSKVRKDAEDYYRNGYFCCEAVMASVLIRLILWDIRMRIFFGF